ncbi:MAG: M28 family peptidase [Bacteroidales bacterium]|nr:M28 family peptidase [Bacteroidales bacterium]
MTKIAKIIVILTVCLFTAVPAFSQRAGYVISPRNAETVLSADYLKEVVNYLSSERLGGRAMGSEGGKSAAFWLDSKFREIGLECYSGAFQHGFRSGGAMGRNVIGFIPGTGSKAVLVMAHFDNLGKLRDTFFPGADSNASGVAALLQVARMFVRMKQCGKKYSQTIVFAALDGKEEDLAGASALWERISDGRLGFGSSDISLVVNLDQLGCTMSPITKGNPEYLMMLSEASGCRREALQSAEKSLHTGLELAYDYYGSKDFTKLFYRRISDQRIFLEHGIPSVMFTSGITMLNNKPGDKPETLDYPVFTKRVRLIFYYLERIL